MVSNSAPPLNVPLALEHVNALARRNEPLERSMKALVAYCRQRSDEPRLRALQLPLASDVRSLTRWCARSLESKALGPEIEALWFGVCDLQDGGGDLSLGGARGFDRDAEPGDWDWARAFWSKPRLAGSTTLRALRFPDRIELEIILRYGYAAFAVRELCRRLPQALSRGRDSRVVAVGFDEGDFLLLGEVSHHGLSPLRRRKRGSRSTLPNDVELFLVERDGNGWMLKEPVLSTGKELPDGFALAGRRLQVGNKPLLVPIYKPGRRLDYAESVVGWIPVVTAELGALFEAIAPRSVQRIPARIESRSGRFEALNIVSRVPGATVRAWAKQQRKPLSQVSAGRRRLFRTGWNYTRIIVTRDGARRLREEGPTGLRLVPLDDRKLG
jgi:hypothetical protein